MTRHDPFHGFRFRIEFDGVQQGGFSRVKGLARETKLESYREGGVNDHEHKLASWTMFGNLILERGLIDPYLWQWHESVVGGSVTRKRLNISLQDETGQQELWRWLIVDAFPVKWTGTDLDAQSGQVLFESLEFAHHGIKRA
jgi:phage tail-like protein